MKTTIREDEENMEEKKPKRSANFSSSERNLLIKIAVKYKSVIENKKTDAITWRQKEEMWNKIERVFNSYSNGEPRTAKQLKNKYEAVKKEMKKKHSSSLKYLRGTRGGQYKPPSPPKTEEEIELQKLISLSVEGLQSQYDNDGFAGIPGQPVEVIGENQKEVSVIDDWASSSAALWQTPKHKVLKNVQNHNMDNLLSDDQNEDEECHETIEIMMVDDVAPEENQDVEGCSSKNLENDGTRDVTNITNSCNNERDRYTTTGRYTSLEINKPGTSRDTGNVKKKSWSCRRRPVLPKRQSMSSVSPKFEVVAEKNMELIALQRDHILAKMKQDQEEHDMNMEILRVRLIVEKQKAGLDS